MNIEKKCRDYGEAEDCLGDIDEAFTMIYDDIGEDPLYWCSHCGPRAAEMQEALMRWLTDENRTKESIDRFKAHLEEAEQKTALERN